ncbi:MAG: aminoglycoside phosphotransferase family protein [Alphaproteobacteria bacterium]|nr:aminoglycoside phosphotransferase family protein [Alphaproteobacteria bacterium]
MLYPAPFFAPPTAQEHKPAFGTLPQNLRAQISAVCKSDIADGISVYGSLSATAGFAVTLADGRRVFAKGSHPGEMSHATLHIKTEIQAYETLPVLRGVAPAFVGVVSDGNEDGWTLGLWEYADKDVNAPVRMRAADIMRHVAAVHASAIPAAFTADARTHNYLSFFLRDEKKWRRIKDEPKIKNKLLGVFENEDAAGTFFSGALETLCALQAAAADFDFKPGLIHGDLRLDNILLTDARTYIVDWPNACRGPVVFDALMLSVHLEAMGFGQAEEFLSLYDAEAGTRFAQTNSEELLIMAASMAGFFADQVYRAVPEKMPRLRWMQKSLFFGLLSLMHRYGRIESPPRMSGLRHI